VSDDGLKSTRNRSGKDLGQIRQQVLAEGEPDWRPGAGNRAESGVKVLLSNLNPVVTSKIVGAGEVKVSEWATPSGNKMVPDPWVPLERRVILKCHFCAASNRHPPPWDALVSP